MAFKPTQADGRDRVDVGSSSSPWIFFFFQSWENGWLSGLSESGG